MVKLVHPEIDTVFTTDNNVCWELIVEAHRFYIDLIRDLAMQLRNREGKWVLSDNDKPKAFAQHSELIIDPFLLDPSKNRPLLKRISDRILATAQSPEHIEESLAVLTQLQRFAYDLIDETGFSFDAAMADDYGINNLVNLLGITPIFDSDTLLGSLTEYLRVIHDLRGVSLFVIVGLRTWLNDEEVKELVKSCIQDGITFITIEQRENVLIEGLRRCLIDDSLSEI